MSWTLKEIIQGKPMGHPTHPATVHFPIALYTTALGLDVVSRIGHFREAPVAATWVMLGALIAAVVVITTGMVDWSTMRPGSRVRKVANRHMAFQLTSTAIVLVNLVIRWASRYQARADAMWIVLDAVAVGLVMAGAYLGGVMVYQIGFRVGDVSHRTSDDGSPADEG